MTPKAPTAAERFAAAWCALEAELDWSALGRAHCHEGGDDFFAPEQRVEIFDTGLLFADDLAARLEPGGRSLYVGASVAELPVILCEVLVLEREVSWHDLPGPITAELNRALAAVADRLRAPLPSISTAGLDAVEPGTCNHLWLVSVLTDPDCFPALHDALYERTGELATGRGDPAAERARAAALIEQTLDHLRLPATLTTTEEELRFFAEAVSARGWQLEVPTNARLSAVVGDGVRIGSVERR